MNRGFSIGFGIFLLLLGLGMLIAGLALAAKRGPDMPWTGGMTLLVALGGLIALIGFILLAYGFLKSPDTPVIETPNYGTMTRDELRELCYTEPIYKLRALVQNDPAVRANCSDIFQERKANFESIYRRKL